MNGRGSELENLWVMGSNSSADMRLATDAIYPSWSADGRRIDLRQLDLGEQGSHVIITTGRVGIIAPQGVRGLDTASALTGASSRM